MEQTEPPYTQHMLLNAAVITLPWFFTAVAVPFYALGWAPAVTRLDLALFGGFYLFTAFGASTGLHRYFSHGSFKAPQWLVYVLGTAGSMTGEGEIITWVAIHRQHHQFSDRAGDPHSPHCRIDGTRHASRLAGLWHAHYAWIFKVGAIDIVRYTPDLCRRRDLVWLCETYPLWMMLGLVVPAAIGGMVASSWTGAFTGLLFGGIFRIAALQHVTWAVNAVGHVFGQQAFDARDHSQNHALLGLLASGDGWHNNHHAFPTSARHGLRWWQLDLSWGLIALLRALHIVSEVKLPPAALLARTRGSRLAQL